MNYSVKYILKIFILLSYLTILLFTLEDHYIAIGECAAKIYYYPLDRQDYIMIPLWGIFMLSISLYFNRTSLKMRVVEVLLYSCIITITLICGNDILASRTIDWPDTYKVEKL